MSDPVFTTREALDDWERDMLNAFVARARSSNAGFVSDMLRTANAITANRAAHAHLLNPESDNGHV